MTLTEDDFGPCGPLGARRLAAVYVGSCSSEARSISQEQAHTRAEEICMSNVFTEHQKKYVAIRNKEAIGTKPHNIGTKNPVLVERVLRVEGVSPDKWRRI
jgi:hypothetical protein